jgi:hypothetical protein
MNTEDTTELLARVRALTADAAQLQQAAGGNLTDVVTVWFAPQYFFAARERLQTTDGDPHWEVLRAFAHDWAMLRRGDHSAARLQLERDELEFQKTNTQAAKEREFRKWLEKPEVRAELFPEGERGIKPQTLDKIERELRLL